ncbi:hypothetical protein D3C75_1172110 [compost metagenome]
MAEGADALACLMIVPADNDQPLAAPFDSAQRACRISGAQIHAALIIGLRLNRQTVGTFCMQAREVEGSAIIERKVGG